jgi:hypothetical protein
MLYQLSYASPNSRVSRPKNKTLEPVSQQVHNCQGYHRAERHRNFGNPGSPGFPVGLVALANFMRSVLAGTAHAIVAEYRVAGIRGSLQDRMLSFLDR